MKQKNGAPIAMELQVAILYAAGQKFFADVPAAKVTAVEAQLAGFFDGQYSKTLTEIKKSGQLSDELKKTLDIAMNEFKLAHKEFFIVNS